MNNALEPIGKYLYSNITLEKAKNYLSSLQMGKYLPSIYLSQKIKNFNKCSPEELIVALMNTRKPRLFAEFEASIDGTDWNALEQEILSEVSFVTSNTCAFNDGNHDHTKVLNYEIPLPVNFIYASGALLRSKNENSIELSTLLTSTGDIDASKLYTLYETRILPGLIWQNKEAHNLGKRLVINIPGIGCGQFAGKYRDKIRHCLPIVLREIFKNHANELDMIDEVIYDPYEPLKGGDSFSGDASHIKLKCRPYQFLPYDQRSNQLAYPKSGGVYDAYLLVKVVAWDPFSYPGNDIWGDSRTTDDGVSMASSDGIKALVNMGQFPTCNLKSFKYSQSSGIFYPEDDDGNNIYHYDFATMYASDVRPEMCESIQVDQASFTAKSTGVEVREKNNSSNSVVNTSKKKNYFFQLQIISGIIAVSGVAAIVIAFVLLNAADLNAFGLVVEGVGFGLAGIGLYGMYRFKEKPSANQESRLVFNSI